MRPGPLRRPAGQRLRLHDRRGLGVDDMIAVGKVNGGAVAVEKMPVPGIGWLAYAKDAEGNIFGVLQPDPSAKMPG